MTDQPPYSRVRRAGSLLFTAGTLGMRDGVMAEGIEAQLDLALDNLEALLQDEGLAQSDVVRLVVYLTDLAHMPELNAAFTSRFSEPRPTRTTVQVAALPFGAIVEVEATAAT